MDDKIRIEEAIGYKILISGQDYNTVVNNLKRSIWPDRNERTRNTYYNRLKKGHKKHLNYREVNIICDICGCDANLLFGIEKK